MRVIVIGVMLLASGLSRDCGKSSSNPSSSSDTVAASAEAQAAAAAPAQSARLAAPRIGGSVAAVGEFSVEILAHKAGFVEALVTDKAGKPVESADCKLKLTVDTAAKASKDVALSWQPAEARFSGDARAELAPGPMKIELTFGGATASGTLTATALMIGPNHGGTLVSATDYGAELIARTNGEIEAFVQTAAGAELKALPGAKLSVNCQTSAGAKQNIVLAFDPVSASFTGRAAAGAAFAPGPAEFVAEIGGKAQLGRLEKLCLFGAAQHGGKLVAVGEYGVELVAGADGKIEAYVSDLSGKALVSGDLDLSLFAGADAGQRLALRWHAPSACYKGKLKAKLDLAVEPVQLAILAGGKLGFGAVNAAKLSAAARMAARADLAAQLSASLGAKVGAHADAKLAVGAPSVKAKLDQQGKAGVKAAVKVPEPKVDVKVNKSASAGAKAGTGAKASAKAGISIGM